MKFFYVYILLSKKDNDWYTGYTNDLKKRFKKHNDGKNLSTKHRRPFDLIYFEGCLNVDDAKAREKYLKSGMGKRSVKNRLRKYFETVHF
ncbi:MAG: GIY-YIG nuclease family protein [Balneolaceae bacterium]|nr:MAG: GIY-YIG nuclease family protein [Balneolaceae bacterium]